MDPWAWEATLRDYDVVWCGACLDCGSGGAFSGVKFEAEEVGGISVVGTPHPVLGSLDAADIWGVEGVSSKAVRLGPAEGSAGTRWNYAGGVDDQAV